MVCCLLVAMVLGGFMTLCKVCHVLRFKNHPQEWRLIENKEC